MHRKRRSHRMLQPAGDLSATGESESRMAYLHSTTPYTAPQARYLGAIQHQQRAHSRFGQDSLLYERSRIGRRVSNDHRYSS